jgi:hypothetical protein
MGASNSLPQSETINWKNIKTDQVSSTIPNLNGISVEANKLVEKLNLPEISDSSSELNDIFLTKINKSNSVNNNLSENNFSSTSPFISSEMYNYVMDKYKNQNMVGGAHEKNSLEAIATISNGDLRKAINILQSLSMMIGTKKKICIDSCYNSAGIPPPHVILELYNNLTNKDISFEKCYKYIENNIISEGYTLSFLIQELNKILLEQDNINSKYIEELAELEYMVAQSIFNDMYMVGLVAIFKA